MTREEHNTNWQKRRKLRAFKDTLDSLNREMFVTVLVIVMVMLTDHLIHGLPKHSKARYPRDLLNSDCSLMCEPGYYQSNCKCFPCSSGFYTNEKNREDSCHRCFQSCRPDFNMEVVMECTRTSDVKCRCQEGFVCKDFDQYTGYCNRCDPIPATTSTPSNTSTDSHSATILFTHPQHPSGHNIVLIWILFAFILTMVPIIFMTFFQTCKKKKKECFKQFVRQCSLGNLEVESETTSSTNSQPIEKPYVQEKPSHDNSPTNQDCSFHQPAISDQVPSPGNLGPLHIYGPQTVFVSLLNQFGWDGGEKKPDELQEESKNTSNVPHPQSPPINLSQEERNDFIFFPSQEQGKECHISKEEVL